MPQGSDSLQTPDLTDIPEYQSEEFQQAVYLDRIKMLYAGISTMVSATLIGMTILMYVNWYFVDHSMMTIWYIYMSLVLVYRVTLTRLFQKNIALDNSSPKTWVRLYAVGTTLTALGWGFVGSFLLSQDSLVQQMFTTILLAGLGAGAVSTLTAVFSIYVIFLLLTVGPLLITLYSFGDDMHIATGTLVLLFILFILGAARRMTQTIIKSVSLRFMHDAVLKDIAAKKQQTDQLNNSLKQQINERKIVEQHLENSMSQLKATLESAADGILVVDNHDMITNYNQSFIELFNIPADLIEAADFLQVQEHIQSLLKKTDIESLTPIDDSLLLELKDERLIEVFWNPQKIADLVIGGVFSYRDVTTRINSEASLQRAKNEAEMANKEKSEFLSRISHELRTPLNAILGFGHLLRENSKQHLDAEEKDYTSHICSAGEHLLSLIDDLLDISRIEAGKLNIQLKSTSCTDIIEESMAILNKTAADHNIELCLDAQIETLPPVMADHTRCKQALVNLLSNAVKYNQKNGKVKLVVTNDKAHVRFEIHDTGPGIEASKHQAIFQPFTRLKQTEKTHGTGIGLTITKRLIDVMNGSIGVESEPGKGSMFWFELPVAQELPEAYQETPLTDDKDRVITMEKTHTILYIEDEPLNQALVRSIVKQIPNTELLTASTGEEGIEVALENQPDLILMDLNLPGISGYDALQVIKQEKSFSDTPVFAVSANAMPDEIARGKEAGFFDYLIKPIHIDNTRLLLSNTLSYLEKQ